MTPSIGIPPPSPETCLVTSRVSRFKGATRVLTQNLGTDASKELDDAFLGAGFFRRNESADVYQREHARDISFSWDRYNELAREDDVRARARLASGEKMFDVYNASG